MRFPWQRKGQPTSDQLPPVVRPPSDRPITEFEAKRLKEHGVWLNIQIQVTPRGSWTNWRTDIPHDLRTEAKDAIIALALALTRDLQKKE